MEEVRLRVPLVLCILINICSFILQSEAYIYCDPFSHAKMLKCVCGFLDYVDIHSPANVENKEPLLCRKYLTYKECSKSIPLVCKTSIVGHLENLYDVFCNSDFKGACKFVFAVDLKFCPLKPLCDGLECYVNHGSEASLRPEACPNSQIFLTTEDATNGVNVSLSANAIFSCNDEVLSFQSSGLTGPVLSGVKSVRCTGDHPNVATVEPGTTERHTTTIESTTETPGNTTNTCQLKLNTLRLPQLRAFEGGLILDSSICTGQGPYVCTLPPGGMAAFDPLEDDGSAGGPGFGICSDANPGPSGSPLVVTREEGGGEVLSFTLTDDDRLVLVCAGDGQIAGSFFDIQYPGSIKPIHRNIVMLSCGGDQVAEEDGVFSPRTSTIDHSCQITLNTRMLPQLPASESSLALNSTICTGTGPFVCTLPAGGIAAFDPLEDDSALGAGFGMCTDGSPGPSGSPLVIVREGAANPETFTVTDDDRLVLFCGGDGKTAGTFFDIQDIGNIKLIERNIIMLSCS